METPELKNIKEITALFSEALRAVILCASPQLLESLSEIRLRAGMPVVFVTPKQTCFLQKSGRTTCLFSENLLTVSQTEIQDIVSRACGYSVHSHQEDFQNGFLTLPGGHRIGLCGTAVTQSGKLTTLRNITALNIRLARQIPGAATDVLRACFQAGLQNILIAGPPMSGKTTVLRDLIRSISDGYTGKMVTCTVVDERGELLMRNSENAGHILGCNTDVLSYYQKSDGIRLAVRALAPQMIFCDEIGSKEDADAILEGIRCGVHFAVTAHAGSFSELYKRSQIKTLLSENAVDSVVMLGIGEKVGKIEKIMKVGEPNGQGNRDTAHSCDDYADRQVLFRPGA